MFSSTRTIVRRSGQGRHWLRTLYLALAWLLSGGIAAQVFLAGLNVFLQPVWWGAHIQLGHALGALLLALVLVGFAARVPGAMRWLGIGLVLLFGFQYNARLVAGLLQLPELAALHAVNALVLFWGAITLARRAWRLTRGAAAARQG